MGCLSSCHKSRTKQTEMSCINQTEENEAQEQLIEEDGCHILSQEESLSLTTTSIYNLYLLQLPDSILLNIFIYLPFTSIGAISQVCKRLNEISYDEILWQSVFLQHYKLPLETSLPLKATSWRLEFKRLHYHTPAVLCEERKEHTDEVLHVSFSHDGKLFATCSKDCYFKVWKCSSPVSLLFEKDMSDTWPCLKYTRFSQFNEADTRVLVSGACHDRFSGNITVLSLQENFRVLCQAPVRPFTVTGTWYDNDHILAGSFDRSWSFTVQLIKATEETRMGEEFGNNVLYRFATEDCNYLRHLTVADIGRDEDTNCNHNDENDLELTDSPVTGTHSNSFSSEEGCKGYESLEFRKRKSEVKSSCEGYKDDNMNKISTLEPQPQNLSRSSVDSHQTMPNVNLSSSSLTTVDRKASRKKLFVFAYGSETYGAHKIGIKEMSCAYFPQEEETARRSSLPLPKLRDNDEDMAGNVMDKPDHTRDMHGRIVGLSLSPDNRYLYVNRHPWPKDYVIDDSYNPPTEEEEMEISTIDLMTFDIVGPCLRSHKASCITLLFAPHVSNDYVCSGAGELQGYLWDRHYSILLYSFHHEELVGYVITNPKDQEMLVTASDDHTFRVWASRRRAREQRMAVIQLNLDRCK